MLKAFLAAVQFLTRFPVPKRGTAFGQTPWSTVFYPIVGSLLGLAAAAIVQVGQASPGVAAGLALLALFLLTGGLHEDGLADSADALMVVRGKERSLEIMHDSRTGALGAAALVFLIVLKWAALASMGTGLAVHSLILAHAGSRWLVVLTGRLFPSATDQGLGGTFRRQCGWPQIVLGLIWVGGVTAYLAPGFAGILAVAATASLLWCWYVRRRLDGLTGDSHGASIQIFEAAAYAAAALAPLWAS